MAPPKMGGKLIVVPPITRYDYVGKCISEYPAPVIRDRILVLSREYGEVHVIFGSMREGEVSYVEGNIHAHVVPVRGRLAFFRDYFSLFHNLILENPGATVLNMNPLWAGFFLNTLTVKKQHRFATLFISFPEQWSFPRFFARLLYRINMRLSDSVIAVTPSLREYLAKLYGGEVKVVTNRVRENLNTGADRIPDSLFYAARIAPEKRQDFLVKAMKQVVGEKPKAHLYLAGDGDQREIRNLVDELKLNQNVTLLGGLAREEVYDWMSKATVFTIPSIHEGFGLVYLEAMSCATPIIATDSGSTSWVIGDAGVLVKPNDTQGFAKEIIRLLDDEKEREKLTEKGHQRIKEFSYDTWGKDLRDAIEH